MIHTHVQDQADIINAVAAQGFEDLGSNRKNLDALAEPPWRVLHGVVVSPDPQMTQMFADKSAPLA